MSAWWLLIVRRNVQTYVVLLVLCIVCGFGLKYVTSQAQKVVELPIAIQNHDATREAAQYVKQLKQTAHVRVIDVPTDDRFLDTYIQRQQAVAVVVIPKDYHVRIKNGDTKALLTVYVSETIASQIALELLSKHAYEQQLPAVVTKHLQAQDEHFTFERVYVEYQHTFPKGNLTHQSFKDVTVASLPFTLMATIVLILSLVQVPLNRPLSDRPTLDRAGHIVGFYSVYSVAHAIILVIGIALIAMITGFPISFATLFMSFIGALLFECSMAALLLYVRTWSHQLFMAALLASLFIALLFARQLGG